MAGTLRDKFFWTVGFITSSIFLTIVQTMGLLALDFSPGDVKRVDGTLPEEAFRHLASAYWPIYTYLQSAAILSFLVYAYFLWVGKGKIANRIWMGTAGILAVFGVIIWASVLLVR